MFKRNWTDVLRYVKWIFPYKVSIKNYPVRVMNFEQTINLILANRLSVSRFGDGELRFMLAQDVGNTFEINSEGLSKALKLVLNSNNKRLLVCLPSVYADVNGLHLHDQVFWQREVSIYLKEYYKYLKLGYNYGDAFFSRPYQIYQDSRDVASYKFSRVKEIWKDRYVILIEGELTRFGVGNDLLSDACQVKRILAPATNAFESIDRIYEAVRQEIKNSDKDSLLILLSLGPTATILADKISTSLEIQSIDIGHLDIEYEWFQQHATAKVPIRGKYVNESIGDKFIDSTMNSKYLSEIIARIQ